MIIAITASLSSNTNNKASWCEKWTFEGTRSTLSRSSITVGKWFCSLNIQLIGTIVWFPKMHKVPPEVDFESSRSPAKSESWNSPNMHCLAVFPTWQYCLYSLVWWIYEINRFRRLSEALVHFVTDGARLFTDHRISSLPNRARV